MIVDAILAFLFAPFTWLLSIFPTFTWPSWMADCPGSAVCEGVDYAGDQLAFVQGWIDLDALFTVANFTWTLWFATQAIRGGRFLLSLFTGGGGA